MDVPSVYQYQDPVAFIADYYRAILTSDPSEGSSEDPAGKLTLRKWAHQMGLDKPQVLVEIIKGTRKIQFKHLDWIFRGVKLDDSEKFYFRLLVQRANATSADERLPFDMLLAQMAPSREQKKIYLDDGELFVDWFNVAVFSFCRIRRVGVSREMIVAAFEAQADRASVEKAIERLLAEGLIYQTEAGHFRNVDAEVCTTADIPIQKVQGYYRQVLELAEKAIDLPPVEREFQCFSVAIDSERLPVLKRMLRSFRKQVIELSDSNADQVFQVNLQAFPVSASPIKSEELKSSNSEQQSHATYLYRDGIGIAIATDAV